MSQSKTAPIEDKAFTSTAGKGAPTTTLLSLQNDNPQIACTIANCHGLRDVRGWRFRMREMTLLVLAVLALLPTPLFAQDTLTPTTKEQTPVETYSALYSEENRIGLGCQRDAWEAIIEWHTSVMERRKMQVTLTEDLQKHIMACSKAAQTMHLKRLIDARDSFKSGDFDKGNARLGKAEYLSLISSDADATDSELLYNALHEAFDKETTAYLSLVDEFNGLVVVLKRMPRATFAPTFTVPTMLNCRSFSSGSITTTTCE